MSQRCRILAALGAALLATACAPSRLTVKPEFWQDRQARIGIALTPRPEAAAHRVGAQGLLDIAINEGMTAGLRSHLRQVDVGPFDLIRDRFVEELKKRGLNAVSLSGYLDPSAYPTRAENAAKVENPYNRDLAALRADQKLDVLVLLQVRRYGTIRPYYGFVPLGSPQALFEVMGQMVDLRTGGLLWQIRMPEQQATVPVSGEWDDPPDYPNLTAALRAAIAKGGEFLWSDFMNGEPAPPENNSPEDSASSVPQT